MKRGKTKATLQRECDRFNAASPVGTPVRYWPGVREGAGREGVITHLASVLGGHTAVGWIGGCAVAITHIQPVERSHA